MGPWLINVETRDELDQWLGDSPPVPYRPVVMVVRGDGPVIREFLPNALDAAKLDDRRVVVWVKDVEMLSDAERQRLFRADDEMLAAVLSEDREVKGWVYRDRIDVEDVAFAFSEAGQ